ncbi:RING/U-box superfamily protein [Trifolium repens]|nr:RING/U-box superfamily protein [Trifolium repens]
MEKTKTEEWRKHHRNQINHKPILETDPNNNTKQIRPIIQSTRCKATISSLLLSTFSNETSQQQPTNNNNKKINFSSAAATIRGLGCTAAASHQVSVPAVIRASADWPHQGNKTRKKNKNKRNNKNTSSNNDGSSSSSSATCVDFQDVWCGPGIGFSTDAAASVDCVVSKKNSSSTSRAKIDLDKITHRGSSSSFRRRTTVHPENFSFPDNDPDIFTACTFGTATYPRHIRDISSDDFSEIMALQGRILMGRRFNSNDLYRDWRLDVDNMSYEQLLELGEKIGYVNTGLEKDEIEPYIRKTKLQFCEDASKHQVDKKCSICQEEYEADDELGRLNCDHMYHFQCIQQWVAHKNFCPVCKQQVAARH